VGWTQIIRKEKACFSSLSLLHGFVLIMPVYKLCGCE
jgi:hypothetical protein